MSELSRRVFLSRAAAVSAAFAGLRKGMASETLLRLADSPEGLVRAAGASGIGSYGPLVEDAAGVFDLPKGFSYTIFSRAGEEMDDGLLVPGKHDGMACFAGPDAERVILIRNHEIDPAHKTPSPFGEDGSRLSRVAPELIYDRGAKGVPSRGGCSTIVYNLREKRAEKHFMSLMGTERNCAGGPTPYGTWISCEETTVLRDAEHFAEDHGWCFEVVPTMVPAPTPPRPIKAMGRFNHEACCTDPRTGIVYLTEDEHDGLLYRYVPRERENLLAGGLLQALKVVGRASLDTRNWPDETTGAAAKDPIGVGQGLSCVWIDLAEIESPQNDLRLRGFAAGAARFARGEGMWWGQELGAGGVGSAYFCGTNGGPRMLGQVWKLTPSGTDEPDTLELFVESLDAESLQHADNITFAPWGDLVLCEDGDEPQRLIRVRPDGSCERLGRNRLNGSELAGATFSPDGSTLFVNIQTPGLTLAITGPWRG